MMDYLLGIVIAVDQLVNALIAGDPDEMISARAYKEAKTGSVTWTKVMTVIDTAFFWQTAHCKNAWEYEKAVVLEKAVLYNDADPMIM
jgi:hypothetical protein